ncbi:MAG: Swt1 family HEPN domain-containing protein [Bacillota bacterium]
MAMSNIQRIGKLMELLKDGLTPFVKAEMEAHYGDSWLDEALRTLRKSDDWGDKEGEIHLDVHALLILMWYQWNEVFSKTLGHAERSLVSELRIVRNDWAHQKPFSTDDAQRAMDSAHRLLTAIASPLAPEAYNMSQELLRVRFEEQARRKKQQASVAPVEGKPAAGLRPWREIITPHPDVASGKYQEAEFAADLAQVYKGEGKPEYQDPREFFNRTYLTEGLKQLLNNALLRLSGQGGDPVVELRTNFGGGKTHSMLALYHLFSGVPVASLPGVDTLLAETGVSTLPTVRRAVLVGTALSPGMTVTKSDGTVVHTMWGELAWQLGGRQGYEIIAQADIHGVSPGSDALQRLFSMCGPSLILIDEWVAFIRMLHGKTNMPAGSFDANLSFAQALTEAVKRVDNVLLIASIPASDIEIGGEAGRAAVDRLRNVFARMESMWRPASAEEGYKIVRRRLFQSVDSAELHTYRDAVVQAYAEMYRNNPQEFPSSCREADYSRKMQESYPIHPELFDRLYNTWSSLDKFQRTRGVLRLMAAVINVLWERNDNSLLIMPSNIPIDDPGVQNELTRYLEDSWQPVIEKDVDGPYSLPLQLDRDYPNLGRLSACRRVSRTIYMGAAPTFRGSNPGIDDRSVKLGCVQPGESSAIFGDALRRLTDQATYLYVDGNRYWFSTQPSVTRLAQDRAASYDQYLVWEELKKNLRKERERGDFAAVHIVPDSSNDVPDEMAARLVILGPENPHTLRDEESSARKQAEEILLNRGSGLRVYRNTLVFLAPDGDRLRDLEQSIRDYLAWKSISEEREELNLNAFQVRQAQTKCEEAEKGIGLRLYETYSLLLVPTQPEPQGEIVWEEARLQGNRSLAIRASNKLKNEENLITQMAATRLRLELDRYIWREKDHIGLKQLWEYFASYLYLPRLKNQYVLTEAVESGITGLIIDDTFGYAERWDPTQDRYVGLKSPGFSGGVIMDGASVLIKPEIALKQLADERQGNGVNDPKPEPNGEEQETGTDFNPGPSGDETAVKPKPVGQTQAKRFYGVTELDATRFARDANTITQEIIQHFASLLGAEVEVTLEISAKVPGGIPENVIRTVTENCRTLQFRTQSFEEE